MSHNKKICAQCVMDETDPGITFDENGVCDHCITFSKKIKPFWNNSSGNKLKINEIADKIRKDGAGHDYDCIVGMSGGIDSSYLVHLVKKELNLRPLVFHVDAGWNSQEAVNNIEKIVDGLELELFTEVINWEEIKDLQLAFFKSGVPHIDTPQDHAFFATMYKYASKHGVKHILTGGNYSTECIRNPLDWMYYQSDSTQIRDIHKKFGTLPLNTYPLTNILWHKVYLPYFKGIKVLRPLDYLDYNKKDAIELLVKEYGYQTYPQKHFESRFTKFYEGYWLPVRFGFDTRKVQFSSLILTNQMTRSEALDKLATPSFDAATIEREFEYIADKLEISKEELQSYLDMPKKTHRDYKSQQNIYRLGSKILKSIGIEKGGKR
jgi:N-acetyl sugar amidotransferase